MTVIELKQQLDMLVDAGFGDIEIAIPVDDYNEWVKCIDHLQLRPFINCIAICTHSVQHSGIEIMDLLKHNDC